MRNQSRSNKNRFTNYVIGSIHIAVITPRKQTLSLCLRSTLYKERSFFFLTTDLCMVQPGMLVASARRYASRKRRVGAHHSGNLRQIASVITRKRVYNLEFTDYSGLKSFYNMIEAVFAVQLLSR